MEETFVEERAVLSLFASGEVNNGGLRTFLGGGVEGLDVEVPCSDTAAVG